jgi:hypothetical protein
MTIKDLEKNKVNEAAKKIVSDRELALRTQIRVLDKDNAHLRTRLGSRQEMLDAITASVVAMDPYCSVMPVSKKKAQKPKVDVVLDVSDLHVGQRISAAETEGFGNFNWRIAQERFLDHYIPDSMGWVNVQREAYDISTCHVLCLGDYVSGDLRVESSVTNEFPAPVQAVKSGMLVAEGIRRIAANFEHVVIEEAGAGNHDRLTMKPQSAQRSSNSYSYIVHAIINQAVKDLPNIEVHEFESAKGIADIAGKKFLLGHGDTIKTWMGIPYYGMEREAGREARRRMRNDLGFDYINIGHWHVASFINGYIVVNGSLCGTSEYDHLAGRYAPPCQVAYLVHPKHGLFNLVPFYV